MDTVRETQDPIRAIAWICLFIGIVGAVLGVVGVPLRQSAMIEAAHFEANTENKIAMWRAADSLSAVPWLLVGGALAGFGLLLLAIRRPAEYTEPLRSPAAGSREASMNDLPAHAIDRLRPPQSKS